MTDPLSVLDKLERIAEQATPGPWLDKPPGVHKSGPAKGFAMGTVIAATAPGKDNRIYAEPPGGSYPAADLRLIRVSRTAVPALVRGLRKALEGLGQFHDSDCGQPGQFCAACAASESALSELRGMEEE